MKIPYVRAIDKDTGRTYEGYYFEYPRTTYCCRECKEIIPCLVTYRMVDWGLPNEPQLVSNIDTKTIELICYVDTDKEPFEKGWVGK